MQPVVYVGHRVLLLSMVGHLLLAWCRLCPLVAVNLVRYDNLCSERGPLGVQERRTDLLV